jgi:quercetin dioxygenase-like cupin family protein
MNPALGLRHSGMGEACRWRRRSRRFRRFRVQAVTAAPGQLLDHRRVDWEDALVVVERGELAVECADGAWVLFREGAVLTLSGLTVRRLHNPGARPLVLQVLSRPSAR